MTEQERGARQIIAEEFDFKEAVGGVRGIIEGVVPAVTFVVTYVASQNLTLALILSLVLVTGLIVTRLIQRGSLIQSITGFGGVLIGLLWAWFSGEARDYFAWGLIVNALYGAGCLISILIRRPVVGLLVQLFTGVSQKNSPRRGRYVLATWIWVAMFAARLGAQFPLYQANDVAWLGTLRVVMGVPLFAVVGFLTWLIIRERPDERAEREEREALELAESPEESP